MGRYARADEGQGSVGQMSVWSRAEVSGEDGRIVAYGGMIRVEMEGVVR